jgi:hypothetical protein
VIAKSEHMAQKVLMRIPHHSAWGTCLLQNWIPRFNSSRPVGLKVPTWVILKAVPDEFVGSTRGIPIARTRGSASLFFPECRMKPSSGLSTQ